MTALGPGFGSACGQRAVSVQRCLVNRSGPGLLFSPVAPRAARSRRAHGCVAHDDEQVGPFGIWESLNDVHDGLVYLLPVRLPQPYDQNAVMRFRPVLGEPFVCRDQHARFSES